MKLTLIKEDITDKSIVDEVMETHLYEDEQDKKAKENNELKSEDDNDVVDDILDPEESTGFDIPDEPLPLENNATEDNTNEPLNEPVSEPENEPLLDNTVNEPDTVNKIDSSIITNSLNGVVDTLWSLQDNLKEIKYLAEKDSNTSNLDAFNKIIDSILDDVTINIGMVYKLIQLHNPELELLLDKGKAKAEEVLLNRN